jgi:hypothetical protein
MSFGTMTFGAVGRSVIVAMILWTNLSIVPRAEAADWTTVEIVRTEAMSDTSSPIFQGKDEKGPFGRSKISLRCADEGWGSVSLERVRGRFALDHQLGLKSWPEVTQALQKNGDAYLRGERLKFREIFVHDDSGPIHPRDELAAFGDSEKGFKYKFAKFDECSKVETETLMPGQICVVTLQVMAPDKTKVPSKTKAPSKTMVPAGHVRYRSIKCTPNESNASAVSAPASPAGETGNAVKKTTAP